jgi:hypothetical protein
VLESATNLWSGSSNFFAGAPNKRFSRLGEGRLARSIIYERSTRTPPSV